MWILFSPQPFPPIEGAFNPVVWDHARHLAAKRLSSKRLPVPGSLGTPMVNIFPESVAPQEHKELQVFASQFSALVSLSIEIYTLLVARVPRAKWRRHIGRGQFPQVKLQSVMPRKPALSKYDCPACCLWATLCHSLATLVWHAGRVASDAVPEDSLPKSVVNTVLKLKGWREQ